MRDSIRFLSPYILPYRKHFAAFYAGWLAETVLAILLPKLLGIMLDQIIYEQDLTDFFKVGGAAAVFSIYSCVLYYWLYAQHHYLMIMFTFQIKIAVFEKFLKMQPLKLESFRFGEIVAVIQEYPAECMHFLIRGVIHQVNNFVIIAVVIVFSFRISMSVGSAMIFLSALCGVVAAVSGNRNRRASLRQRNEYGSYVGWLYEILENSLTIQLLNAQGKVEKQFRTFSEKMFCEKNRMENTKMLSDQLINGVFLLSRMCIFAVAVYLTSTGELTIGTFTVIIAYFGKLTDVLTDINRKWNDAQTRAGYIRKIRDFMSCPDEKDSGSIVMDQCQGDIRIENLTFSYSENVIFRNFNLHIRPGEKVAVTGASGSGKSTLAELLTGMLEPYDGVICIDGIRTEEYTLRSFRKRVGILFQEPLIIGDSLRDNLLTGKRKASDEEMWKALQEAGLGTFAEGLPQGLDTCVRGNLSGGQCQRLGIAQLYLKDPDILILDEPTSALDEETEHKILKCWGEIFSGKTLIIITHRKAPLSICDREIRTGKGIQEEAGAQR